MSCSECEFRIGTATYGAVVTHLRACADSFHPPLHTYVRIEDYARKILDNAVTFEAWNGGELVGLIAAYFNDTENKTGFITDVSVLEEHRGFGIASELMRQVIEFGINHAFVRLNLEVGADNTAACILYERNCFVVIEQRNNKLLMSRILHAEATNGR